MSVIEAAPLAPPGHRWPDGFFTAKDGTRLHYVEAGEGTPVILIHGARGSAIGNWFSNGIAPRLALTNHVYALDMRGHGLSGGRHDGPGRPGHWGMADDVLEFMDQMGIEKAHIGGYSMGGGITLHLLNKAPERFLSACFQGAGISEVGPWRDKVPADVVGKDPDEEKAQAMVAARRQAKGEEVGNNFDARIRAQAAGKPAVEPKPDPEFERRFAEALKLDLSTVDFPVMAINGEYDRPNARTHRMARELKDFTNLVLPGKGHLTAMMAGFIPEAYVEGYAAFITRANPKA